MQRQKPLPCATQLFFLKNSFSNFKIVRAAREKFFEVEGTLTPLNKTYRVRIIYSLRKRPIVTLPDEIFPEGTPHIFKDDNSLCLYHRDGVGAWTPQQSILKILPMIAHWLWCYEMWKARKKWYGDEHPHPEYQKKEAN